MIGEGGTPLPYHTCSSTVAVLVHCASTLRADPAKLKVASSPSYLNRTLFTSMDHESPAILVGPSIVLQLTLIGRSSPGTCQPATLRFHSSHAVERRPVLNRKSG